MTRTLQEEIAYLAAPEAFGHRNWLATLPVTVDAMGEALKGMTLQLPRPADLTGDITVLVGDRHFYSNASEDWREGTVITATRRYSDGELVPNGLVLKVLEAELRRSTPVAGA